jgi:hypothetical protein
MSVNPLFGLKGDIHECLQVVEAERDAVTPGTGLILERPRKGRGENGPFSLTFCQIVA